MKSLCLFLLCMCYAVAVVALLIPVFVGITRYDFNYIDGYSCNHVYRYMLMGSNAILSDARDQLKQRYSVTVSFFLAIRKNVFDI